MCFIEYALWNTTILSSLIVRREFAVPSLLTTYYWEYFSKNSYYFMKDSIVGFILPFETDYAYPEALRRVTYVDLDTNKRFVYLTNIFTVPAITVADIYKQRWQIELFFRWIKQHLRIKTFYGTSPNAVKTQIWIAVSIYLLVAILKKRLQLPGNLHTILQILEVNIFEKRPIIQIVKEANKQEPEPNLCNQLNLFNS